MLTDMEQWTAVRHALFVEKISLREAARRFRLNFRTIPKISNNETPTVYDRLGAESKITPFLPFLEHYLEEDKALPRKQRHTAKRIYERLREEHGYPYTYRTVCHTLAKLREKEKPLFMPLAHPPGQAQFDFGYA